MVTKLVAKRKTDSLAYSWLVYCERFEAVLERVGNELCRAFALASTSMVNSFNAPRTTARKTSSPLFSVLALPGGFPPLPALLLPLCDICVGERVAKHGKCVM